MTVGKWFRAALRATETKIAPINQRIAIEAAEVVTATGHKDPGDCYLIATSRVRNISIVSRDSTILAIGGHGYLDVLAC